MHTIAKFKETKEQFKNNKKSSYLFLKNIKQRQQQQQKQFFH